MKEKYSCFSRLLLIIFLALYNMPILPDEFKEILSIWGFHEMFWSKNTPRNFLTFADFIEILLIMNNRQFSGISIVFFKEWGK